MVTMIRTDTDIKKDVLRELEWDPRVDATDVGVEVREGVVTLRGTVRNYAKKLASQEAAHRVAGVLDVVNAVEVEVPGAGELSDREVARAVRHALTWDARVPDEHIHSTVTNGWVTLTGTVDRLTERDEATRAVARLRGVAGVSNDLSVREAAVDPQWLRRSIEEALARQAHLEAEHLEISVEGATVRVSGAVRSRADHTAVLEAVGCAPGVCAVEDGLVVDGSA
jgi:osmotically-inducible protein OsmY